LPPDGEAASSEGEEAPDTSPALIAVFGFLALYQPGRADPAPAIHYAPAENLERIDVALIDAAMREIDFAAYVLTDWPVIEALARAADRGVKVRAYLDGTELAEREPAKVSVVRLSSTSRKRAASFPPLSSYRS
jgi:phosphatidylserine/phosphatidylglycerophosphate/cardiolipin synthase-like enzyme